jgi:hypothetical protein
MAGTDLDFRLLIVRATLGTWCCIVTSTWQLVASSFGLLAYGTRRGAPSNLRGNPAALAGAGHMITLCRELAMIIHNLRGWVP